MRSQFAKPPLPHGATGPTGQIATEAARQKGKQRQIDQFEAAQ